MDLQLAPISLEDAHAFLAEREQHVLGDCSFAIACEDHNGVVRGVIIMYALGGKCGLTHLYTDATSLVGSLLYGAAWRAAKALGYKTITI